MAPRPPRPDTVMSEFEIQSEPDRYIEEPAQALSHVVGRQEIQRLRGEAERKPGPLGPQGVPPPAVSLGLTWSPPSPAMSAACRRRSR
ncbi:MAG TPA: DUF885 family protein [Pseudonocardiaceae bacterium]|nr:DUF885 family protein [Pseudonocardiaceae bacterium]